MKQTRKEENPNSIKIRSEQPQFFFGSTINHKVFKTQNQPSFQTKRFQK